MTSLAQLDHGGYIALIVLAAAVRNHNQPATRVIEAGGKGAACTKLHLKRMHRQLRVAGPASRALRAESG